MSGQKGADGQRVGTVERQLELPVLDIRLQNMPVQRRRKRGEPARVAPFIGGLRGEEIGIGLTVRGGRCDRRRPTEGNDGEKLDHDVIVTDRGPDGQPAG